MTALKWEHPNKWNQLKVGMKVLVVWPDEDKPAIIENLRDGLADCVLADGTGSLGVTHLKALYIDRTEVL